MFIHDTMITVRYAETDQMGIVHHSNYAIWFEYGRTEAIKKIGVSYPEIENMGVMLPLINMKCGFRSPAKYGDDVIVRTHIKSVSNSRLTFGYEVLRKEDEKLLTYGETEHVWTDTNLKPINIKKRLPDVYKLYANCIE